LVIWLACWLADALNFFFAFLTVGSLARLAYPLLWRLFFLLLLLLKTNMFVFRRILFCIWSRICFYIKRHQIATLIKIGFGSNLFFEQLAQKLWRLFPSVLISEYESNLN
jgi:hypothetical protein